MSVTLMYHKNGKEIPIKMSIWDAFRGAPSAKTRSSREKMKCPCCDKIHEPKSKDSKSSDKSQDKTKSGADKDGKKKDDKPGTQREEETYSGKDDKKITTMKAENKSWKEILAAINKKSESQLKAHWKEIRPKEDEKAEDKTDGKSSKDEKEKEKEKSKKDEPKKSEKDQKKKEEKKKSKDSKSTKDSKAVSLGLASFADSYDKRKWLAVASRHYDKTGERISAEMAKKMVKEGKLTSK